MSDRGCIDTVETIRRTDAGSELWLREVLEALHPHLNRSQGIFGCAIDAVDLKAVRFVHGYTVDAPSGTLDAMMHADLDPDTTAQVKLSWFAQAAGTVSTALGDQFASYRPWQRYLKPCGVGDLLMLNAMDDQLAGISISVPFREVRTCAPAETALLERITAHLLVAQKLRQQADDHDATVEAVLTPDGRVAHAAGVATRADARLALGEAVRAAERARGKLRRSDPREALELWQAMAGGRWALVDQFDSDGRRYIVARVTELVTPTVGKLTRRESQVAKLAALGHSNKMIAYELGIALSTVATHLGRAVRKSGVRSVRELGRVMFAERLGPAGSS